MNTEARIISDGFGRFFVEWWSDPQAIPLDAVLAFARDANGKGIHLVIDASHRGMTDGALDLHTQMEVEGIAHDVVE